MENCKCLGQRKQHKQLCVIYSDNADHMAWLTFRDNYKAGMRKGWKIKTAARLEKSLNTRASCLLCRPSRVMKFCKFEAEVLRKLNDLWVNGINMDYMLCNFNLIFNFNSY